VVRPQEEGIVVLAEGVDAGVRTSLAIGAMDTAGGWPKRTLASCSHSSAAPTDWSRFSQY
jgi:hypothetical protein